MRSNARSAMVGRADQLATVRRIAAGAAVREPGLAVVVGEAGIGKTRLVEELAGELAGHGVLVLRGTCSPIAGRELTLGPFIEVLRDLQRALPTVELDTLIGSWSTMESARTFDAVVAVIARAADSRPVLVVIEDLHWADRSSSELLEYLLRRLRQEQLAIVVTVRTDDLAYEEVRGFVADLLRHPMATRVSLSRLGPAEVEEQLRGLDPAGDLTESRVGRIVDLSDGVPLLVEELHAAGDRELEEVADQLLAHRISALPADARAVVDAASLAVTPPRDADLASVVTLDDAAFDAGLAVAIASGVLVRRRHTVDFRHALLREATEALLLPHVARSLHRCWAEVADVQPANLAQAITRAHHRSEAGQADLALDACLEAMQHSDLAGAFPENHQVLLKAIELWPRVGDAEARTGMDLAQLLSDAAESAIVGGIGDEEVRRDLLRRASAALPPEAPPERTAWLDIVWNWSSDGTYLALPELLRTVAAIPPDPPSRFRYWACQEAAEGLIGEGRFDEAEPFVEELLVMAEGRTATVDGLRFEAGLQSGRGQREVAVGTARKAVQLAERMGWYLGRSRSRRTLAGTLWRVGDIPGAVRATQEAVGLLGGEQPGPIPAEWGIHANNLVELLMEVGRWPEAHDMATRVLAADTLWPGQHEWALLSLAALASREGTHPPDGSLGDDNPSELWSALFRAEACAARQDLAGVRAATRPGLEAEHGPHESPNVHPFLCVVAQAEADLGAETNDPWVAERVTHLLDLVPPTNPWESAYAAQTRADLARCRGAADPETLSAVVDLWRHTCVPFRLGWALVRLGESHTSAGKNDLAREALDEAVGIGAGLGAAPLVDAAYAVGRRARIRLTAPRDSTHLGLTAREEEVLMLLAEGATNTSIAGRLSISPKTASVHVTHILEKLGVATRGEAAAWAYRHGLVDLT